MSHNSHDWFVAAICSGICLMSIGAVNLVLLPQRTGVRFAATLMVAAATLAIPVALNIPCSPWAVIGLTGSCLAAVAIFGAKRLAEGTTSVIARLGTPQFRFGFTTVLGFTIIVGTPVLVQWVDDRAAEDFLREVESAQAVSARPRAETTAWTDQGTPLLLRESQREIHGINFREEEEKFLARLKMTDQLIRRGEVDKRSNCHGWVFTGGRFTVTEDQVALILRENGYEEVSLPEPGDLVIYGSATGSRHTAIVRYATEGQSVLVEGKWGGFGVFLHSADTSPYGDDYTFYSSPRQGHLLRGIPGYTAPMNPGWARMTE
jgi:hypothetical protein